MKNRLTLPFAFAIGALATAACAKKEQPPADSAAAAPAPMPTAAVTTIEVGKSIDASKRITDTTSTLMPRDTMYISVVTSNATPITMLKTVVTFQDGQVVDSTSQAVATATAGGMGGSSVTEFHLTKPGGWPTGDYTVEVFLDGQSAGTRTIKVNRK